MAIRDSLTQLYNRRYFDSHFASLLDQAQQTGKPLSLLMIDIDHFKEVNDHYGHVAGDAILRALPGCITDTIRSADVTARYGGEEFVVLMPAVEASLALDVAQRIRRTIAAKAFTLPGQDMPVHCTVSIGGGSYLPGEDTQSFLQRVDQSLYLAKAQGRNQVVMQGTGIRDQESEGGGQRVDGVVEGTD